jgi:hypothetical protein
MPTPSVPDRIPTPEPDDDYTRCLICGEPGAALQRVYDGHYQRTCYDSAACRRREAARATAMLSREADRLWAVVAYVRPAAQRQALLQTLDRVNRGIEQLQAVA